MKNHKNRRPTKTITPSASAADQTHPTHSEIAARAHDLYQASGCAPGHDLENWLRAEAELSEQAIVGTVFTTQSPA